MYKSFSARLAALEALDAAQQPERPPFVCFHALDWEAYDDLSTPAELRQAIAEAYQLDGGQSRKAYCGLCMCDPPESCRVCRDEPVVGEL